LGRPSEKLKTSLPFAANSKANNPPRPKKAISPSPKAH
jgi:hypothetical protein